MEPESSEPTPCASMAQRQQQCRNYDAIDEGQQRTTLTTSSSSSTTVPETHGRARWRPSSSRRTATTTSSSSMACCMAFLVLLIALCCCRRTDAVRCYCTDEHCVPYGVCEAAVCLVGLLRSGSAVIRTCGNEPLGCQRNLERWSRICSCEEHFCNTYLFLKASTNIDGGVRSGGGSMTERHAAAAEDDHRVFERVDPPAGDFATFDHSPMDEEERTIKNSNLLTLLLVIVPLSVGAAAVVVVAINYYCHLC